MLRLICGYIQQNGRSLEEKLSFYDELIGELDMHSAGDLAMYLGNFNGHFGGPIDAFDSSWRVWRRSEEFGIKNVARFLSGEGIMHVKNMVYERGKEQGDNRNG